LPPFSARVTFGYAPPIRHVLLTELLTPERVRVPLKSTDKRGVLRELAEMLVAESGGELNDVLAAVEERELALSTGIGYGVAIPHGRSPTVPELGLVCGVTSEPIPFDSLDGDPVRLLFMIVGPESASGRHVKLLSRLARLVRREAVRDRLIHARTPLEFYNALLEAEVR
jgi:mannitol/fructose-specific phosphotransferase system IIA component (Ntr-type)